MCFETSIYHRHKWMVIALWGLEFISFITIFMGFNKNYPYFLLFHVKFFRMYLRHLIILLIYCCFVFIMTTLLPLSEGVVIMLFLNKPFRAVKCLLGNRYSLLLKFIVTIINPCKYAFMNSESLCLYFFFIKFIFCFSIPVINRRPNWRASILTVLTMMLYISLNNFFLPIFFQLLQV